MNSNSNNHSYNGQERRAYVRIPYEAVIQIKKINSGDKVKTLFKEIKSKNISQSGLLLKSREQFNPGTLIELEFSIPTDEGYSSIQVQGKVIRVVKNKKFYDNGILFHKIKKKDEKTIANFVEFLKDTDAEL